MSCKEHMWSRSGPDSIIVSGKGRREVTTCNNCLATKVVITHYNFDFDGGDYAKVEVVVEPPEDV